MKWSQIKKYLPVIGILLFVYLLIKLDASQIWKQLISAEPSLLVLSVVLAGIYIFVQPLKWHFIALKQNIHIPYIESFKIGMISNFYGLVTPSRLGEVIRASYIKKYSGSTVKGVGNFILEKIFDLISIFFLAIIFVIIFRERFEAISLWYLIILFLIIVLGMFIFINKKAGGLLAKAFYRFLPEKMIEKAGNAFDDFYKNMPGKGALFMIFLVNLFIWIFLYFVIYIIGLSLGIEIGFAYYLAIMPISTLISQIPITISGLGTREASMIGLFGLFGISAVKVFSMSLLNFFITGILPTLLGIYYSIKLKK